MLAAGLHDRLSAGDITADVIVPGSPHASLGGHMEDVVAALDGGRQRGGIREVAAVERHTQCQVGG